MNSIGLTDKRLYFMMRWGQCGWIEIQKLPEGDEAILRKRDIRKVVIVPHEILSDWHIGLLWAPGFPGIIWNVLCIHCFVHFNGFMFYISPNINFLRAGVCCILVILKQMIQMIEDPDKMYVLIQEWSGAQESALPTTHSVMLMLLVPEPHEQHWSNST